MTPGRTTPTALIVGASRGLGLGLARAYARDGWRVHATTRRRDVPGALGDIEGDLILHDFDVRDAPASLLAATRGEPIDLLVHNAGVAHRGHTRDEVMAINAAAPIRVAEAFLPQVAQSEQKKIVLMTSQLGARRGQTGSLGVYGDSKAALNDAFRARETSWAERGVVAIALHPGWVRTDMGGASAPLTVAESVAGIQRVIAALGRGDHGAFLTWEGAPHPW